jgi:hypothetical protein
MTDSRPPLPIDIGEDSLSGFELDEATDPPILSVTSSGGGSGVGNG